MHCRRAEKRVNVWTVHLASRHWELAAAVDTTYRPTDIWVPDPT